MAAGRVRYLGEMRGRPGGALALWTAVWALGCSAAPETGAPARLDALFPDGRRTLALEELAARGALAPDQEVRVVELGRDAHTSQHLVSIRHGEEPHRHERHDLLVLLLRGHGSMQIADERRELGQGSLIYVPRGSVHAFRNAGEQPAVAYVVYLPPFDGRDRVPVEPH